MKRGVQVRQTSSTGLAPMTNSLRPGLQDILRLTTKPPDEGGGPFLSRV
jgi:hypothetical protein